MQLTAKEHETFDFIQQFIQQHRYAPTITEIAHGIGVSKKSRGTVHRYVSSMVETGLIKLIPGKHRNIRVIGKAVNNWHLPIKGKIAAGKPIEAVENTESLDMNNVLIGNNRFLLVVKGDSMIDEGIYDGDYVLCEHRQQAKNGDIIVALIDKCEATLKRFYQNEDNSITLIPSNSYYQPIVYEANRIDIQGIYCGLLRFNK